MSETTRQEFANGLRQIAAFYEAHPEVPIPADPCVTNATVNSEDELRSVGRALGTFRKDYYDTVLKISKKFGCVSADFLFMRDVVCTRRVIGVEEVPEKHIEAQTIPAHAKEIVEWDCGAAVLSPVQQKEAANA